MSSDSLSLNVARTGSGLDHVNTIVVTMIRLKLFTPHGDPMPGARYRLTLGDRVVTGKADGAAWIEVRATQVPETCQVEWDDDDPVQYNLDDPAPPADDLPDVDPAEAIDPSLIFDGSWDSPEDTADPDAYRYVQDVYLRFEAEDDDAAMRRLHNVGLTLGESLDGNVREFEAAYGKPITGDASRVKDTLWDWHDNGTLEPCVDAAPADLA
jgi:hypothetical protein